MINPAIIGNKSSVSDGTHYLNDSLDCVQQTADGTRAAILPLSAVLLVFPCQLLLATADTS